MKFRNEYDSLGVVKVPHDKYWGASTQRSNKHFDIGDFLVRPIVIKSIAMIKKAAAIVNTKNGDLNKKISKAIIKASNEIISGKLIDNFPQQNMYGTDYQFFASIGDRIRGNVLVHDEFFSGNPFPTPREDYQFVGQVFDENEEKICSDIC